MKIVFKNIDGTVGILSPTPEGIAVYGLQGIADKDVPTGLPYRFIEDSEIPTDRYFREAWEDTGSSITPNRTKAEKIHMDKLRVLRDKKLKKLDVDVMRNIKNSTKLDEIETKKQTLRDMPENEDLSLCETLDDLKNYIPDYLGEDV